MGPNFGPKIGWWRALVSFRFSILKLLCSSFIGEISLLHQRCHIIKSILHFKKEGYDKIGSNWLPSTQFWKPQTNFLESLTPRLPLMQVGLPRLRNFANVYTSASNRNDSICTYLQDWIFFVMQIDKIANIFPKNHLKNVTCANIQNCFWLGDVIDFISSNWKVIAICADSYITDIFFSCKRVIYDSNTPRLFSQWLISLIYWLINHCTDWAQTNVTSFSRQFNFHDVIYHNKRRNIIFTTTWRSKCT